MHLYAKRRAAVASGDYYQILFDSADRDEEPVDPFDEPAPYLMVQRQFEFSDGGKCYVESDDDEYIVSSCLVEFSTTFWCLKLLTIAAAAEFEETQPIVEVIFGIREPDCDELGFDGPL
jgi:hypothetical protein